MWSNAGWESDQTGWYKNKVAGGGSHLVWTVTDVASGLPVSTGGGSPININNVVFNAGTGVVLISLLGSSLTGPTVTIGGVSATIAATSGLTASGGVAMIAYRTGMSAGNYTVAVGDAGGGASISRIGLCAGTLTNEVEPFSSAQVVTGYAYTGNPVTVPSALTIPANGIGLIAVTQATIPANQIRWLGSGGIGYGTDMVADDAVVLSLVAAHITATGTPSYDDSGAGAGYMGIAAAAWSSL